MKLTFMYKDPGHGGTMEMILTIMSSLKKISWLEKSYERQRTTNSYVTIVLVGMQII